MRGVALSILGRGLDEALAVGVSSWIGCIRHPNRRKRPRKRPVRQIKSWLGHGPTRSTATGTQVRLGTFSVDCAGRVPANAAIFSIK